MSGDGVQRALYMQIMAESLSLSLSPTRPLFSVPLKVQRIKVPVFDAKIEFKQFRVDLPCVYGACECECVCARARSVYVYAVQRNAHSVKSTRKKNNLNVNGVSHLPDSHRSAVHAGVCVSMCHNSAPVCCITSTPRPPLIMGL